MAFIARGLMLVKPDLQHETDSVTTFKKGCVGVAEKVCNDFPRTNVRKGHSYLVKVKTDRYLN